MEIKKKRDYRNPSKIKKGIINIQVNKTPVEKSNLKYKVEETEDVNVETVNTSKILDRIEKEKSQVGFSLERLDNIDNSKVIGDLDINLSSRIMFSSQNEKVENTENEEINENTNENIKENKKNKCTCDEIYMIKFILIMFLVGMLILFVILIINWSRKD
jgi:hypothetical protein